MSDLRERVEALANRVDVVAQSLCLSPGVDSERMDLLAIAKELRTLLAPRDNAPGLDRQIVRDSLLTIWGGTLTEVKVDQIMSALAARPVAAAAPSLESAAWDMLHAVEAADAAGELAENIGGELIDALRAALVEGEN